MVLPNWPHLFACSYSFIGGLMIGIVIGIVSARLILDGDLKELKQREKR
jgi:uncharacterized membrane-anchored protein YhcB (DUF1043 family)